MIIDVGCPRDWASTAEDLFAADVREASKSALGVAVHPQTQEGKPVVRAGYLVNFGTGTEALQMFMS